MRKYLYDYIDEVDSLIDSKEKISKDVIDEHLIKIGFFQHERLIHLYVTFFYAIVFLIFAALGLVHFIFCFITIILFFFLVCYVIHYFRMEYGVQYLYKQYDKMIDKSK